MADKKESALNSGTPAQVRALDSAGNSIQSDLNTLANAMPVATASSKGVVLAGRTNIEWASEMKIFKLFSCPHGGDYSFLAMTLSYCGVNTLGASTIVVKYDSAGNKPIWSIGTALQKMTLYYTLEDTTMNIYLDARNAGVCYLSAQLGCILRSNWVLQEVSSLPESATIMS